MKVETEDAVALAMDWLAQLREDGHAEPPSDAEDKPAATAVPAPSAAPTPSAVRAPPAVEAPPPAPAPPAEWAPPAVEAPLFPVPAPPAEWAPPAVEAPLPPVPAPPARWAPRAAADPPPVPAPPAEWAPRAVADPPPVPAPRAMADPPPVPAPRAAAAPPAVLSAAAAPPASTSHRRAGRSAGVEVTERAAIGDELRIPIAWCEMGACISHHADPLALGEADNRARAIAVGWRVDALRRLACPKCQQSDSWFWTAHPIVRWDRDTAVIMTALMTAAARDAATTGRVIPRGQPAMVPSPARGRHREHPRGSGRAMGEGRRGSDPTV